MRKIESSEQISHDRRRLLGVATMGIAAAGAASMLPSRPAAALERGATVSLRIAGVRVPFLHGLPNGQIGGQSELASLERADAWLNSPPLTAAALRGKVVLTLPF